MAENQELTQLQRLNTALAGIDSATNDLATEVGDVKTRVQDLLDKIKEAAGNPDSGAAIATLASQAEETLGRLGNVKTVLEGVGKTDPPVDPPVDPQP